MRAIVVWLTGLALVTTSCGNGSGGTSSATEADTLSGTVQVFTAASLTEAFTEMGKAFETMHPNVEVTFNFGSSSSLAQQINQGGPADVFVSADESNMKKVTDTGIAAHPQTIARNRLAIVVEKGNPKAITGLADLGMSGVVFALCALEAPCGRIGAAALTKAGVTAKPASLEDNVKAVVAKVTLGEADAGIVYMTDVTAAAGKAAGVDIDGADDPSLEAVYPIAVTRGSSNLDAAQAWIEYVLSDGGQATLATFGFLSP